MTAQNLPQRPTSTKICSISGCGQTARGRGYCNSHYMNWYRHGNPLTVSIVTATNTLEERFWIRVTPSSKEECWEWEGTQTIYGYGQLAFRKKLYRAHRVSFFLHNGYWPKEVVMHDCDNKICVNPHHLKDGTYLENTKQAHERGLYAVGERQGHSKLKEAQVLEIKRLIVEGMRDDDLADKFEVGRKCINAIRHGYSWRHIPWPSADDTHPHRP